MSLYLAGLSSPYSLMQSTGEYIGVPLYDPTTFAVLCRFLAMHVLVHVSAETCLSRQEFRSASSQKQSINACEFHQLSFNSFCCMLPVQLSSLARRHIKLDHLEEFHCVMPKDMPKPQDAPKTPIDPSTAPAASLNTGASTSRPQDAASQQVDSASPAKGVASQSEAAASHQQSMVDVLSSSCTSAPGQARLGSADSLTDDAVSKPWDSAGTTSGSSRSSSSSSASDNGRRSSNLQDTNRSHTGNISTAKAGSISSVGLDDTQVAVGNNGDATSNLSKTVDGVVSKTREADAATASAPQQAAQEARLTKQNVEEEEAEQALSGSVSKSGFEFCGSGDQFKVSCKAEAQHSLICCQSQESTIIALNMGQITSCRVLLGAKISLMLVATSSTLGDRGCYLHLNVPKLTMAGHNHGP